MKPVEILKDIYWVGVVDWNIRNFHGYTYTTKRGTTYNSYLIIDEKIALIDTVYGPFANELIKNIKSIIKLEKIDYIITNHVETDHSGTLSELVKLAKNAKIIGTARCKDGLSRYYYDIPLNEKFQVVKTGESILLGKKTLQFIEAPMIHWPDSMFTYIPEEKLLLPNDAFGQHYATTERFDDEVNQCELMEEAKKYYANILVPLSSIISKKLEQIVSSGLEIKIIAPSHGIIWRKDPKKILDAYIKWANNLDIKNKVLVVYETMWGATEKMARTIIEGLKDTGIDAKLYDITISDRTEIITELLDAKGLIVGSSTHDNNILPSIAGFLDFVKGLRIKSRYAGAFGSYGWSGESVKIVEEILKESGFEIIIPSMSVKYMPSSEDLDKSYKFGQTFANGINQNK